MRSWLARLVPYVGTPQSTVPAQHSEFVIRKPQAPDTIIDLLQPHRLVRQRVRNEDHFAMPTNLPATSHLAHLPGFGILDRRRMPWILAHRGLIPRRGCGLIESLMRTILVVLAPELIEAALLRAPVGGGGTRGGLLQGAMHAFMPSVLLRLSRFVAAFQDKCVRAGCPA